MFWIFMVGAVVGAYLVANLCFGLTVLATFNSARSSAPDLGSGAADDSRETPRRPRPVSTGAGASRPEP